MLHEREQNSTWGTCLCRWVWVQTGSRDTEKPEGPLDQGLQMTVKIYEHKQWEKNKPSGGKWAHCLIINVNGNLVVFKKYHFFLYTMRGLVVHSPWQMSELSSLDVPEMDTNQRSYISEGSLGTHVKIYAKTLHKCKLSHSDQKRTD